MWLESAVFRNAGPELPRGRQRSLPLAPIHLVPNRTNPDLLGAATPLFDDNDLPPAVVPTRRTDVMNHVWRATGIAADQNRHVLEEIVAPPVALTMAGDPLLW